MCGDQFNIVALVWKLINRNFYKCNRIFRTRLVTSERKAKFDRCKEAKDFAAPIYMKRPEKCQLNFYPPMQAFENKAVCSRMSHS